MKTVVEIRGLSFTYPDGTPGLNGVDLDILEGETLGIIGPNGAGKSTLLMHLNGLLGNGGAVTVLGKPVVKANFPFIRQAVGHVFQDPADQLFMPTVAEDVAFGPRNLRWPEDEVERRVGAALAQVGLEKKRDHLSHHMSLGEQRRAALATDLSKSPQILVLDEPNSSLDPASRRHLIRFLGGLPITKVLASHDLDMVLELASRVVVLDGGRIVAEGAPREILSDRVLLEAHGLELPLCIGSSAAS
jgi:cobalt/nickel transport system ATP-binding protein